MSYEKQNFVNDQILTADHLNHIEDGIERLNQELYHDARIINNLEVIWDGQINDQEVTEEYTINNIQHTFVKIADFEIADATMCNADMKIDINIFGNHSDSISNKSGAFVNNACVIKGDKYNIVIVKQDNTDVTMDGVSVNFSKGIWFTKCYDSSHPYAKESFTRVGNLEIISGYVKLVDTIFTENKPGLVTYDENGIALGEIFNSETNKATGECSHAEGWMCNATGKYSHAEGSASRAEGDSSHAECRSTVAASATYGHAEGYGSKAVGQISHAEGYTTEANGNYSHAEGHNSISSGTSSHAEGENCNSNGKYSHAEGFYTIASGNYQHVQGRYNVEDTESKYAHIIGNGTSGSARSNAHTLDWNGNAWFAGNVSINGTPVNDNDLVNKQYVDKNQLGYDTREYTNINISYWNGQIGERENVVLGDYTFVKMDDLSNCPDNVNHCEYYGFCRLHTDGSAGMPILYNSMEDHSDINDYYLCKHDNGAYFCAIVIKDSVVLINDLSINLTKGLWFIQTINPNLDGTGIPEHILKTVTKTDLEEFKLTLITGELKLIDNVILGNKPGLVIRNEKGDALGEIFNDEDNIASEPYSHAEGCSTQATARGAHVEGFFTKASGLASHAEGYQTKAASQYQHVQGQYNIEDTENKYAHIVGNGAYNKPSNAHTLDWNGNAWFAGNVLANNLPYDTRELQEINITFDGNPGDRETIGFYFSGSGSLSANGLLKITDDIYENIESVETVTVTSPTSVMVYSSKKDEIVVTDDYVLAGVGYRYVVSVKNDGTYELNPNIKPVTLTRGTYIYYSNAYSLMYMSDVKLIINANNGDLSVIDEKYLINSPGRYQEGETKIISTDEGNIKVVCKEFSEIFNSESNIATGGYSHAEGYMTCSVGDFSHAEGSYAESHGEGSHAEGSSTYAKGTSSHAEGSVTQAKGNASHAEGYRTIASVNYQHVQGQCNIEDTEGKYAHIVGNGTYSKRSNAHTLDWNGNAWFAGNVSINGTPANDNDLVNKQYVDALLVNNTIMNIEVDDLSGDNNIYILDHKYQRIEMINNANIIFPEVDSFTEIHLYFDPTENLVINLPDCRKKQLPDIVANKSYELVAIYNMNYWLVEMKVFE